MPAELLPQLAESLEGQVGAEDGRGDLILALLDPLGEGDFPLPREQRDPPHLAQIEPHGALGAPDGAGREVDRLWRAGGLMIVAASGFWFTDLGGVLAVRVCCP